MRSVKYVLMWCCGLYSLTALISAALAGDGPPIAPKRPVIDDYHGTKVVDPYRYMEDLKNPEVQAWIKGQAQFAEITLAAIPGRAALLKRITELDDGAPFLIYGLTPFPNGDLFYYKMFAADNVPKFYYREAATGTERLLIDPDKAPKQDPKQHFALGTCRVSPEASKVLYCIAASGSEQATLRVFDISSGRDLPEVIEGVESEDTTFDWLPDGRSFVYMRRRKLADDAPPTEKYKFKKTYRHTLGTLPKDDPIILAGGAQGSPPILPTEEPAVTIPLESNWAIGTLTNGVEREIQIFVAPRDELDKPSLHWNRVCDKADQVIAYAVHGDDIYLITAKDALRRKVVRTSLAMPDLASAPVVVPTGDYVIESIGVAKDALYVGALAGSPNKVLRLAFTEGAKVEILPTTAEEPGDLIEAVRANVPGVLVRTFSWIRADRLQRFDPATHKLTDTGLIPLGKFDTPVGLVAAEVFVSSHDGVKVPLSIIHRKDLKFDASNPTLLTGYGAYGIASPMFFDPIDLAWLERGGVLAIAHVRGGGAYGKEWHLAGFKSTKPNTWKDFIACGEYLVRAKYTSPAKLAGQGTSAGGILIGRAIIERPDLFAAAHIEVGSTDTLRAETTANGPPNIPEFGTTTKKDEFEWLLQMSTLQQIRDGVKYPAVLVTHGINDPWVEPWQSAKTVARFQAATASGKPILFRVDYQAGHGFGSTKTQRQEQRADLLAFLLWQMGVPGFQP